MTDLPEGFVLEQPDPSASGLPPGFVLESPGAGATALGLAKAGGVGLAKGAIGLAGMFGDTRELLAKGGSKAASLFGQDIPQERVAAGLKTLPFMSGPTSPEIQSTVEGYTGEFRKPQTTGEKYAETIASFAPASLAGPGGIGRRLIAGAVIPGAASETAGQLPGVEGTAIEPYARAAAAITAGAGAILASPGRTTTAAIQSQLPDYVTPRHVQVAEALMKRSQARGVDLTWPEALSQVTNRPVLTDMQRILESAPQSRTRMQNFFADRPQQIEGATRAEIGNIAPPHPNPTSIGREVGTAAEGAVNEVREGINTAAEPYYRGAEGILLTPTEMAQARAVPGFARAAAEVRADEQLNRYVAHLPDNSIGFLNEVKKVLNQQTKNATAPLSQNPSVQRAAGLGKDATTIRNIGMNATNDPTRLYESALNIEDQLRQRVLQPILDPGAPLGRLASRDIKTRDAIEALFPKNPTANANQISDAVAAVAARNPNAASQLVRAHIEYTLNDAATRLQAGGNQNLGAKLAVRLTGNPAQRANLQAAVEALPNGPARWQGLDHLLEIAEATGRRQGKGSLTSFNTEEMKLLSGGTGIAEATKTIGSPGKWWSIVNDKWTKWQLGQNLDGLARIISDPRSGPLLERLAGLPRNSSQAGAIAARLILQGDAATAKSRQPLSVTVRPQDAQPAGQ